MRPIGCVLIELLEAYAIAAVVIGGIVLAQKLGIRTGRWLALWWRW